MKAFFSSLIVMAVIAVGSDILLGGPLSQSGALGETAAEKSGILVDSSAAKTFSSPNVRLDD